MSSKESTSQQSISSSLSNTEEDNCSGYSSLPQENINLESMASSSQDKNTVKEHIFNDLNDFFEKVSS